MNERSIFAAALDIADPEERAAYLDRACGQEPGLRGHLEALLEAEGQLGSFLARPAAAPTDVFTPRPLSEGPGTRIGPYKLLQPIGEGGMGVVYMAEQETPVRRKVALKIIRPGMDSRQVIARFEAERQALAMMDHQNIAKVLDAGTTEHGRPYFVMELVKGVPITEYSDANRLSPRERLELFVPVCRAIQHAHQKGVIHRDIKPSNVLVSLHDGVPVPKVIDFGVAKAIEQRLTERTMFTQHGAILGTLEYMSPEQAENSALDIDTRSDVYSLGVLLYELLTGGTPLERSTLREAGYAEILRRIKEEEPPRPSNRLGASREALASISSRRKTEPSKLAGLIRGELDWIVMKALEKDRSRRYETAVGFARDIERYLHDEAVEACPPSAGYRLRKFASKHRAAMATASSFAILLILGAIVSTGQAVRARRAEDRAILETARVRQAERQTRAERDRAVLAERETEAKRKEAEAARQSLRRSLYGSDIQQAQAAWDAGNLDGMRDLLERQRPRPGESDLRGFEWNYLRRLGSTVLVAGSGEYQGGTMSPDGTRYVLDADSVKTSRPSVEGELELRLLDGASGREVRRIVPYPGESIPRVIRAIKFSPNGDRFLHRSRAPNATIRGSWRVKVWDWASGRELFTRPEITDELKASAFDQRAGRLAMGVDRPGEQDGSDLTVWDLDGGKPLLTIPIPDRRSGGWSSLAFSPDGARIAALTRPAGPSVARAAAELRIWDAASGQERIRCGVGSGSSHLAYSPDGRRLAVSYDGGASHRVRDADTGDEILELTSAADSPQSSFDPIAFSPDGSRLACASHDGKLRIWDVTPDESSPSRPPECILGGNNSPLTQAAWSPDGRSVSASGLVDKRLTWPIAALERRLVVRGPDGATRTDATSAAASSRFAAVFATPREPGEAEIKVWDEAGQVLLATTEAAVDGPRPARAGRAIKLSGDGTRLACLAVRIYRGDDNTVRTARDIRVWEIASGRVVYRRDGEGAGSLEFAFSRDGRLLATSSLIGPRSTQKPSLTIWDLDSGEGRLAPDLDQADLGNIVFSPDGRRLAGVVSSGSVEDLTLELRSCDVATGRVILSRKCAEGLTARLAFRRDLAYSGDGQLLALTYATRGGGGVIKVLDAASGEERQTLVGHNSPVSRVAFSPDNRRLASSDFSMVRAPEVKLWDLDAGRDLLRFTTKSLVATSQRSGSSFPDCHLSFSPDGQRLSCTVGGWDRDARVLIWDASPTPEDRPPAAH